MRIALYVPHLEEGNIRYYASNTRFIYRARPTHTPRGQKIPLEWTKGNSISPFLNFVEMRDKNVAIIKAQFLDLT